MEAGTQKGHMDMEIIEVFKKAISLWLNLRDTLELRKRLMLDQHKIILKEHTCDDHPEGLYQELLSAMQGFREST